MALVCGVSVKLYRTRSWTYRFMFHEKEYKASGFITQKDATMAAQRQILDLISSKTETNITETVGD